MQREVFSSGYNAPELVLILCSKSFLFPRKRESRRNKSYKFDFLVFKLFSHLLRHCINFKSYKLLKKNRSRFFNRERSVNN